MLALTLLEQGRGVLIRQALRGRDALRVLRRIRPDLAQRFDQISEALALVENPGSVTELRQSPAILANRRWQLAAERIALVEPIRSCDPAMADFLQPPAIDQLAAGTTAGPAVVVNISEYRCDALLVAPGGVRLVPCRT